MSNELDINNIIKNDNYNNEFNNDESKNNKILLNNSEYILNKSIFNPPKSNEINHWKNRLDKRMNKYYYSLLNIE